MRKLVLSTLLSASLLATAGCADGIGTKQGVGTLGGAAAGGLAGAQIGKGTGQLAATAGGVLLGALLGASIEKFAVEMPWNPVEFTRIVSWLGESVEPFRKSEEEEGRSTLWYVG